MHTGTSQKAFGVEIPATLPGRPESERHRPITAGETFLCRPKVVDVYEKAGKSGAMAFVVRETYVTDQKNELVATLRRIGYDSRGYWLQSAIALVMVSAGRLFGPQLNINYAFADPFLKRSWGGAVTHVAVIAGFMVLVAYPLSHLLVSALCRRAPASGRPVGTPDAADSFSIFS